MKRLTSFSELREVAATLPGPDRHARQVAKERQEMLTKPQGSLGRLEEIALWLAAWQGVAKPKADRCQTIVFAGNHGIAAKGVSAFPPAVTEQMVANFRIGGAAINQLCRSVGSDLDVIALDLDRPTADFTETAAMSSDECLDAINKGIDAINPEADIIALGEMGIGNTTSAAALCFALFGDDAAVWVGRGTGVDDATLALKAELISSAVSRRIAQLTDPMDILRHFGGREFGAIFGATLAARHHSIPVIIDGFVCSASVAPLAVLNENALDHCLIGHSSVEPGHRHLLQKLGQTALLDLGMRLGEASGAALALGIVKASVALHNGMATFTEAGVSDKKA